MMRIGNVSVEAGESGVCVTAPPGEPLSAVELRVLGACCRSLADAVEGYDEDERRLHRDRVRQHEVVSAMSEFAGQFRDILGLVYGDPPDPEPQPEPEPEEPGPATQPEAQPRRGGSVS